VQFGFHLLPISLSHGFKNLSEESGDILMEGFTSDTRADLCHNKALYSLEDPPTP